MVSKQVVTMANCIVGVSVLAMPFCFKQCGVVLATLLLLLSGVMTRTVCYFLLKASTITRRRTYELLAYHTYGPAGKLVVEISIIGFLVGTLIAFLVVMGDLGPEILSDVFDVENNSSLRCIIMTALSLFVALPLGLLRNLDSLTGVSTLTMLFYMFLVFKIFSEGMGPLWSGSFLTKINYWRPAGVLQCIPIFSMALSCQTQIFGIYDSLPDPSLQKMNEIVKKAIHVCTVFYISVGFLGYIAFCTQDFGGNIIVSFGPTWSTHLIKVCFVLSIAFSFPLVIFPCRASLHSLIFKNRVHLHHHVHDMTTNHIPESRLKVLTVGIIIFTLIVGLLIPNIELVLGLVGSTTGSVICIIFPAAMFIRVTSKNTTERLLAQFLVFTGILIMILTTYVTLYAVEKAQSEQTIVKEHGDIGIAISESGKVLLKEELNKGMGDNLNVRMIEKSISKVPLPAGVSNSPEDLIPKAKADSGGNDIDIKFVNSVVKPVVNGSAIRKATYEKLKESKANLTALKYSVDLGGKNIQKEKEFGEKVKDLGDKAPPVETMKRGEESGGGERVDGVKDKILNPEQNGIQNQNQILNVRDKVEAEIDTDSNNGKKKEKENVVRKPKSEDSIPLPVEETKNIGGRSNLEDVELKKIEAKTKNISSILRSSSSSVLLKVPENLDAESKLNAQVVLLQLKEHEKEQKKLLQEQKEILAKLKQHQAEDELKEKENQQQQNQNQQQQQQNQNQQENLNAQENQQQQQNPEENQQQQQNQRNQQNQQRNQQVPENIQQNREIQHENQEQVENQNQHGDDFQQQNQHDLKRVNTEAKVKDVKADKNNNINNIIANPSQSNFGENRQQQQPGVVVSKRGNEPVDNNNNIAQKAPEPEPEPEPKLVEKHEKVLDDNNNNINQVNTKRRYEDKVNDIVKEELRKYNEINKVIIKNVNDVSVSSNSKPKVEKESPVESNNRKSNDDDKNKQNINIIKDPIVNKIVPSVSKAPEVVKPPVKADRDI